MFCSFRYQVVVSASNLVSKVKKTVTVIVNPGNCLHVDDYGHIVENCHFVGKAFIFN